LRILGISAYYHDSAIAIVEDGNVIYAAQEERFSRIKNDASFPILAIKNALEFLKISIHDIDYIVYYEKPFLKLERIFSTYLDFAPKGFRSFIQAMHVWTKDKLFIKQNIYDALSNLDANFDKHKTKLFFSEHHLSHAASAFFPAPFEQAAILTIDGVGEYATTSLAFGNQNQIKILKEIFFPNSIGLLYSAITYFLGFKVNSDEYKVMGLAAYGNENDKEVQQYISIIENNLIYIKDDGSYVLNIKYFTFPFGLTMVDDDVWENLFQLKKRNPNDELTQQHCNIAFAFQKITEKAVLKLCLHLKAITNAENLCLSGGVALNCVINGIVKREQIFKNIYIQPASGDAGGALGAALVFYFQYLNQNRKIVFPDNMQNSLLGNTATSTDIQQILHSNQYLKYECCQDDDILCEKIAKLIAAGNVVGWFQGRMEFGPRALGNRSILADARNENMQRHLNLKIKNRESFRPFAPAVLEEYANDYFCIEGTSPYMLEVHQVKNTQLKKVSTNYFNFNLKEKLYTKKSTIPAITHVDFSARIQTVNKETHPLFWKLIYAFYQQTNCPMLINTSFNVKDEPIVCSAIDAFNCFRNTGMDILVIDRYIFYK
jgi:carbamoyltransferase